MWFVSLCLLVVKAYSYGWVVRGAFVFDVGAWVFKSRDLGVCRVGRTVVHGLRVKAGVVVHSMAVVSGWPG